MLGMYPSTIVLNHITPKLETDMQSILDGELSQEALFQRLLKAVGKEDKILEESHALRDAGPAFSTVFQKWTERSQQPTHIIWKDSGRLTTAFREKPDRIVQFIKKYPSVRFLLPLRNPVDVIRSNMEKTDYLKAYNFEGGYLKFVEWYLDLVEWFMTHQEQDPVHFHHLFEPTDKTLPRLLQWLQLPPRDDTAEYISDVLTHFKVRPAKYGFQMRGSGIYSYLKFRLRVILGAMHEDKLTHTPFFKICVKLLDAVLSRRTEMCALSDRTDP